MKYLITPLLILSAFSFSCSVQAKENPDLMKASYYYNHYSFHEAIPYYEKIADGMKDPGIYAQLGDCYRQTGNIDKAADLYDKAVKIRGCSNTVMLRYGQVLMQLTRYTDAERWLKAYQKTQKTPDRRVTNLIAGCAYAQKVQKETPAGTATALAFNTDGAEFAPTIWKGRMVFTSDTVIDLKKRKNNWTGYAYYNIYSVSCDDKGNCGSDISVVADAKKLNIKFHNGPATFSADGKEMYYTRSKFNDKFFSKRSVPGTKDTVVQQEIMIASGYNDSTKEFDKITPFQYNSKDYSVEHAAVSPDGKVLVFASNMPKGAGGSDLYLCKRTGETWGAPASVGNIINTEGEEAFPYWADNNTLYFSSDGHEGLGGLDIYKCHFDDKTYKFSAPENAGMPLNSSYDDISLALYPDDRSAYFSSNRPSSKAGDNIYFYKKEKVMLQVKVKDAETKELIPGAKAMLSGAGMTRKEIDGTGAQLTQLLPHTQYTVNAGKDGYDDNQLTVNSSENSGADTLMKEILLTKTPPKPDTIAAVKPEEPVVIKHQSLMDTPGVQQFELEKLYEVGHFYFDYNKADLREVHKRFLDTLMAQLHRHPTMRVELIAHTDCRGSAKSNQVLSDKRALMIVNYLVEHGVDSKRLAHKGVGASQPAVKCPGGCTSCTEEQHSLNRVLDMRVLHL